MPLISVSEDEYNRLVKLNELIKTCHKRYIAKNRDKVNEYQSIKQKEYYQQQKSSPEFLKKKNESSKKSYHKRKSEKLLNSSENIILEKL